MYNQSTYFYKELDKKNKHIEDLKNRVNTLLDEKTLLNKRIQDLIEKNHQLSVMNEQENRQLDFETNNRMNQLYETIKTLQKENQIIKEKLNKKDDFEKDFNNTITNKLTQAQRKVDSLSVLNTIKDNIINEYQDFINELNEMVGKKFNFILNFSNDDIDLYLKHLNKIKNKVFEHLKFETHHRPYIDPIPKDIKDDLTIVSNKKQNINICKENINKSETTKHDSNITSLKSISYIKSSSDKITNLKSSSKKRNNLKSPPGKFLYLSNKPLIKNKHKIKDEEKCVNTKNCNCRFKEYHNNKPNFFSPLKNINYNQRSKSNYGMRTPPKERNSD